jgi:hypothetical protein
MKAILITTGGCTGRDYVGKPQELVHFIDRPFLQHVIEYLVGMGVDNIDLVLSDRPARFEEALGAGERWGITLKTYLSKNPDRPFSSICSTLAEDSAEPLLLGHACRLPNIQRSNLKTAPETASVFTVSSADGATEWTGWALLEPEMLKNLSREDGFWELPDKLKVSPHIQFNSVSVERCLNVASGLSFLASLGKVLRKEFNGLMFNGIEIEPGIWVSRNVSLRPSSEIRPPVYIDENCRIDRNTVVGPEVVIARNCILANGCAVEKTAILPDSYVGEQLELSEVIVDRNRLVNVRMGTAVTVTDDFILSNLRENKAVQFASAVVRRVVGALLLLTVSPLLLLTWGLLKLKRGGQRVLWRSEVLRIPTSDDPVVWTTFPRWTFHKPVTVSERERRLNLVEFFFLEFLPGLFSIVFGSLSFAGVEPRTPEQVKELGRDWQELYLASKPGLITELDAAQCANPTCHDIYASEVFYVVNSGFWYDVRLILRTVLRWMR